MDEDDNNVLKKTGLMFNQAPRRPAKCGNVQSVVSSSDYFAATNTNKANKGKSTNSPDIDEIVLDDDDDDDNTTSTKSKSETTSSKFNVVKCPTCQRDMTLWSNSRRSTHTKECLETTGTKKQANISKKDKKFTETMNTIRPRKLGKSVDFEDDFVDLKKFRSPKKAGVFEKEKDEKKWELTKDDVRFAKIDADEEANRRRKRPRSFAVVELAPRECQCEVLSTLHSRFLEKFCTRKSSKSIEVEDSKLEQQSAMLQKLIFKNSRLEQLSLDMRKMMEDGEKSGNSEPILIKCSDGEIRCQRNILKHRTTIIAKMASSGESSTIQIDQNKEIVKHWLTFVFTAQIEWKNEQNENIKKLAELYGPADLVELTTKIQKAILRNSGEAEENILEPGRDSEAVTEEPSSSAKVDAEEPLEVGEIETAEDAVIEMEMEVNDNHDNNHVNNENPVDDVFMSDDPLIGFNKIKKNEENEDISIETPATSSSQLQNDSFRTPTASTSSITRRSSIIPSSIERKNGGMEAAEDSFDLFVPGPQIQNLENPKTPQNTRLFPRLAGEESQEKLRFGSNVRILKTNDITPMADYENMDENELKERVKAIGQRPRGKKKMIEILKMAYDTTHPVINPDTPTLRPLPKSPEVGIQNQKPPPILKRKPLIFSPPKPAILSQKDSESQSQNLEDSDDVISDGDKTLNTSNDDLMMDVGRICGDDVADDPDEPCTSHGQAGDPKKTKDLETMKEAFLEWIRLDHNVELYNHLLSLHPVSLEELLARMGKADGIVSIIGKAKLAIILDQLSISFQLPQKKKGGPRRVFAAGKRRK